MAEALSQDEINALMEAYKATGGKDMMGTKAPEKQVRLYDFARPDKFSKEHLRSLNAIHAKHGAAFSASLSASLRISSQADLLALDQLTYREYCSSVPEGTLFIEIGLEPLTSTAIFEFNPLFVSACVDLLSGGMSASKANSTEITDIDKAIIKPMVELAMRKYAEAWSSCVVFQPRIVSMTTETNARQVLLASEAVLICGYEVSVGESVSMMSICIPASAVEAVLPALTLGRTLKAPSRRLDKTNAALQKSFDSVEMQCHAVLGRTNLSLGEVVDLEVGDLIRLPTKANGELEFWIENVAAFSGVLGVSGKNLAVKISESLADSDMQELLGGVC